MNNKDPHITADEARSTIDSSENAKKTAVLSLRPPSWLNAASSLLFGVLTIAACFQSDGGTWTTILFLSSVAFISTYVYWLRQSRKMGTTARLFPGSFASQVFYVAQAVFFSIVIFGSKALFEAEMPWAPYVAAVVNGSVFSYLLYNYPTTEWGARADSK